MTGDGAQLGTGAVSAASARQRAWREVAARTSSSSMENGKVQQGSPRSPASSV
jgi:hypothetical protein